MKKIQITLNLEVPDDFSDEDATILKDHLEEKAIEALDRAGIPIEDTGPTIADLLDDSDTE